MIFWTKVKFPVILTDNLQKKKNISEIENKKHNLKRKQDCFASDLIELDFVPTVFFWLKVNHECQSLEPDHVHGILQVEG